MPYESTSPPAHGFGPPGAPASISVICPTYNSRLYVTDTLLSVREQDFPPAELIVIDDGSTDGTAELVEEILRDFPFPARIIRSDHAGPGSARNHGVRAATSEWVSFLDSDDRWLPTKLGTIASVIRMCPDRNFVCHQMKIQRLNGSLEPMCLFSGLRVDQPLAPQLYRRNHFTPSAVVCRRQFLLDTGLFDPLLLTAQDYELWIRMAHSMRPICVAEPLGIYMERIGSISSGGAYKRVRNVLRIFHRHRGKVPFWRYAHACIRYVGGCVRAELQRAAGRVGSPLPSQGLLLQRNLMPAAADRPVVYNSMKFLAHTTTVGPLGRIGMSNSGLRVLLFHNVLPEEQEQFALLLRSLRRGGSFIDVATYEQMVAGKRPIVGHNYLLTFDDGFKSNKRVADEVLGPEGIKALFFVPTQFIGMQDSRSISEFVAYRIFDGALEVPKAAGYEPMSWTDLAELLTAGHTLGSHTVSHARLSSLDGSELTHELVESKAAMRRRLGIEPTHFAYPYGSVASAGASALRTALGHYQYVHTAVRGENPTGNGRIVFRDGFAINERPLYVESVLLGRLDIMYWAARKTLIRWAADLATTTGATT